MATDPTVVTLAQLNDPTKYVRLDNVPIFCPHERKIKGGKTIKVTESTLEEIADNAHERQTGPGQLVRVTLGHIIQDRNTPETKQPRPVGLAKITQVGTYGPGREPGLLATFYIRRPDWEEVKTYPFRSAEYYPDNQTITGVALLRRDPELDLGTITYDRGGRVCLHYSMEAPMPDETFLDGADDDLKGSKLDTMDSKQADGDDPDYKKFEGYVSKHPVLNYVCQKYAADAAAMAAPTMGDNDAASPSGSNTVMPDMDDEKKMPQSMSRSREALTYAKRLELVEGELAAERKKSRLKDFRRELEALEYAGVQLDVREEMEEVKNFTREQFDRYKARIRKRYEKVPVEYGREPLAISSEGIEGARGEKPLTRAQRDEAVQYASEHDCSFAEAIKHVTARK